MSTRHVPTRRLKSGVLFSAPDGILRVPPDEPTRRPKRQRFNNIRKMIPGVRKIRANEEMDLDDIDSPGLDHQESIAMFAKYVDHPPITSSKRPENLSYGKEEKETLCIPVLKVSMTATVEGTLAHMTLKQSFQNPSSMTIREARHTFPLYDGSVVTAFECTIGDERRLRGVVKPKEQARKEYKEAIRDQTKAAALLEEHTPEIFETSLGNIPPMTTVEIKIVYIQELKVVMMEGEVSEGIALIIPTSIAPRYSNPQPSGKLPAELPHDKLDIEILILNDGHINPDGCLEESGHLVYYHGIKKMESPQRLNGEYPVHEYYFWEHHSDRAYLKKDFVLVVPMQKGHEMQSRAILSPPDDSGLAAMMVSIRPNELFRNAIIPQSFTGEILFLLDRSGSMNDCVGSDGDSSDGSFFGFTRGVSASGPRKIDVLREAMQLVLSGLPKTCSFNIISWGSETWAMWEHSRQHSPENLQEAKEYVSEIRADMGGTDLLRALKSSVERRRDDGKSTQIVVLTDGELDPEEPMEFVWKTRQELQNNIRFFALGIGDDVPRSLIESIAELGGGFGDVVDTAQNPRWHARLNRLTKSALEPDTWECNINIGDGFQQKSLIDYQLNEDTAEAQLVPYFQAPSTIDGLHPFRFTSIFFLIDVKKDGALPNEVTITTTTDGAKKKIHELPIQPVAIQSGTMHQLAAKATLMDLEDIVKRRPSSSRLAEENAQTIGIRYSITSKWTSFVAVPQDEAANARSSVMEHYKAIMDDVDITELLNAETDDELEHGSDMYPDDYHRTYVGDAGYVNHSASLVTGPPRPEDNSNLFEWVRAKKLAFARERFNERILTAQQDGSNVQVGVAPTAQDSAQRQPPTAQAPTWISTNEMTFNGSTSQEHAKLENDRGLPTYSSDDEKYGELPTMLSGPARVYSRDLGGSTRYKDLDTAEEVKEDEPYLYPYRSPGTAANVRHDPSNEETMKQLNGTVWEQNGDDGLSAPTFPKARRRAKSDPKGPTHEYLSNSAKYHPTQVRTDLIHRRIFEPSGPQILNSFDSPIKGRSREGSVTQPSHNTPDIMNPLNWETAVRYQNGQGLFDLPEEARNILHLHFCPNTRFVLGVRLSKILHQQGMEPIICIQMIDSMMMIKSYQTHLALSEDIWDLMMERAQDAIAEAIGQDILETLEGILNDSMMHQHYKAATGEEEQDGGLTGGSICPVCDIRWQPSRAFFCPFDHKPGTPHAFKEWVMLWKHQQEFEHMVCPREGTSG